jgi:predicted nucleotidyltransferase
MKTVQNKEEVFRTFEAYYREEIYSFGVKKIGIFGSFVKRKQKGDSDVDVLVEFEEGKKTYRNFIRLAYFLEKLLGRRVELITPEGLSPYIKPHILKEIEYAKISA